MHLKTLVASMHKHISVRKEDRVVQPIEQLPKSSAPLLNNASSTTKTFSSTRLATTLYPSKPSAKLTYSASPRSAYAPSSSSSTAAPSPRSSMITTKSAPTARPSLTALAQEQKKLGEQLRKEKQAEERRLQLEETKSVLRDRTTKKQLEEEERKRARDAERLELLEGRKKDEEERKQR